MPRDRPNVGNGEAQDQGPYHAQDELEVAVDYI
jgi:hypothetical protein